MMTQHFFKHFNDTNHCDEGRERKKDKKNLLLRLLTLLMWNCSIQLHMKLNQSAWHTNDISPCACNRQTIEMTKKWMFTYCASTFAEHIETKCSSVAIQERPDKTCVRLQHKQFQCMQQYNQPRRYGKKSESFSRLAADDDTDRRMWVMEWDTKKNIRLPHFLPFNNHITPLLSSVLKNSVRYMEIKPANNRM